MPEPAEARTNIENLVDNTGGTVSNTLADVPAAYAEARNRGVIE